MGSKYPQSVRCCLPLWAIMLEAALILIFAFFSTYELPMDQKFMETYQVLQDLTVMAALGLGFLTSSLRRHGWSSVAFNLFMLALGVQWTVLLDGFLKPHFSWSMSINLSSIRTATMSAMAVLISAGSVLGKANLVQLAMMVLVEMTAFAATRFLHWKIFRMEDHVTMMYVHVFAAYFGLTVAWCLSRRLPQGLDRKARMEKVQIATSPSLFAMLGTLFLWIFWPSFNSALVDSPHVKKNAVFNTYYALAASTVTAASASALAHPQGKINMIHLHNAVLAGGVAVGAPGHLIPSPWISMVLGLIAGLISITGAKCLPVCLNRMLEIQDPSGVHYTFGLPGLLGGVTYIILITHHTFSALTLVSQVTNDIGVLSFLMAAGMVSGLLTGLLLNLKIWKAPHAAKYFDDQAFWEGFRNPSGDAAPMRNKLNCCETERATSYGSISPLSSWILSKFIQEQA